MVSIKVLDFVKKNASSVLTIDRMQEIAVRAAQAIEDGLDTIINKGHCLNVRLQNVWALPCTLMLVTEENKGLLQYEYACRKGREDSEYPYLSRHFRKEDVQLTQAAYVHVICYTKAQLKAEGMEIEEDYGIVCFNMEPTIEESPMSPDTLIRNLDVKYGGNGKWQFNADELAKSAQYWAKYARVI